MAADSKIQWTHHTFNPWRGCTKVSDGCKHCYAETMSKRNPSVLGIWGDNGTRVVAAESYWREPAKWNAAAKKAGQRHRVFCASLADVCEDRPELVEPRRRLMVTIRSTPNLDWLLLTKRPENFARLFDWSWLGCFDADEWPENVWTGTSIEDNRVLHRAIPLMELPTRVRFISAEPMIGAVDVEQIIKRSGAIPDWIIFGGESGGGARPCDVEWIRRGVQDCRKHRIAPFVKQLGAHPIANGNRWYLADAKGGDMHEFPDDLQVREFPLTGDERRA